MKANYKFNSSNYIVIQTEDNSASFQNNDKIKGIVISSNSIEMLYENKSIESNEFIDILTNCNVIEVNIQYPSSNYHEISDMLSNIIRKHDLKLKLITRIIYLSENDEALRHRQHRGWL